MNRKLVWLLQLDSSKSVSGILGVVQTGIYTEWLLVCLAMNAVHLGNRLSRDEVGNPFYYQIKDESA